MDLYDKEHVFLLDNTTHIHFVLRGVVGIYDPCQAPSLNKKEKPKGRYAAKNDNVRVPAKHSPTLVFISSTSRERLLWEQVERDSGQGRGLLRRCHHRRTSRAAVNGTATTAPSGSRRCLRARCSASSACLTTSSVTAGWPLRRGRYVKQSPVKPHRVATVPTASRSTRQLCPLPAREISVGAMARGPKLAQFQFRLNAVEPIATAITAIYARTRVTILTSPTGRLHNQVELMRMQRETFLTCMPRMLIETLGEEASFCAEFHKGAKEPTTNRAKVKAHAAQQAAAAAERESAKERQKSEISVAKIFNASKYNIKTNVQVRKRGISARCLSPAGGDRW